MALTGISPQITVGDLAVICGMLLTAAAHYWAVFFKLKNVDTKVEELRRGRGLILGDGSDWPDAVRRCFGFGGRPTRGGL